MTPAPAYSADGKPVDALAFYTIACDPQRSVVVEACAGAGKTWMLVSRIVRALLEGAQSHEILAITFTRKAAGEMRLRLSDWLREYSAPRCSHDERVRALTQRGVAPAHAEELAPALAGLHERVLCSPRPVQISTFHAWFSQLLRAAPLELLDELGLQRETELIEEPDDHRFEVMRRFHAAILAEPSLRSDHEALIAQRGRSQAREWFDAVWDKRIEFELADAAGVLEGSVSPAQALWPELAGLDDPAQALQTPAWAAELGALARELERGGAKAQQSAAKEVETALALVDAPTQARAMFDAAWSALFTKDGKPRKLGTLERLARVHAELEATAVQLRQHDAHVEHLRMVRLSRVLLAEFARYKRARGLADMADLERCALALLRDATLSAWVQERLDSRIRHVLIDEFQDTSPLQWHALHAWLSAYAGAGGGRSGQRAPGVFIVGDPKQSIYRFRRAEPRVFAAAREFVRGALDGVVLECDHTRRNAPQVLAALNSVFERAQGDGDFDGFRHHTTEVAQVPGAGVYALAQVQRPPKAGQSNDGAAPAVWRDSLVTPRLEPEEVLREREATLVALAVRELSAREQVRWSDIFVMCRKRESLRLVAQALREHHVPFAAAEEYALMDAPEARDLVAVLDVLASPQHKLALAQALRSPLFSASDDDLIELAQCAGVDGHWWRALTATDWASAALQRARALLLRWHLAAQHLPPHDLLDRIVAEGELRERVAATVPPEQRLGALDAIDALLAQALLLDGARYATPYNFVRALKRRAIRVPAPQHADAVQLLTVHGAKGLEARVVFVMDADPEPKNSETTSLLVDWPVQAARPERCAFVYSLSRCPPSLVALRDAEAAARRREEINGLYVAMSRAKERLVFSATQPFRAPVPASWWQRIESVATPWNPAPAHGQTHAAPLSARLQTLPQLSAAAIGATARTRAAGSPESDATRLGQAVHRVLEWATRHAHATPSQLSEWAAAAAVEFAAPAAEVKQRAQTILHSAACARFFAGPALRWAGNEVPVSDEGEALRVDRLVALQVGAAREWWVLDYKLQHAPQGVPEYRQQLLRYRRAVQRAQPGEGVRCAFITGEGAVVEVERDAAV